MRQTVKGPRHTESHKCLEKELSAKHTQLSFLMAHKVRVAVQNNKDHCGNTERPHRKAIQEGHTGRQYRKAIQEGNTGRPHR